MVAARAYYAADMQHTHKEVGVGEASENQVKGFIKNHFECIQKTSQQKHKQQTRHVI